MSSSTPRRVLRAVSTAALAAAAIAVAPAAAQAYTCPQLADDFNRASLGSQWAVLEPTMLIQSNRVINPNGNFGLMLSRETAGQEACVDAGADPSGSSYAAITLRTTSADENVFFKVQDNGNDGKFESVAIYRGNNGNGVFVANAFTGAAIVRMHVVIQSGIATLEVDAGANGTVDYTRSEPVSSPRSPRIGLGAYSGARLDNFRADPDLRDPTATFESSQITAGQHMVGGTATDNVVIDHIQLRLVDYYGNSTTYNVPDGNCSPACGGSASTVAWNFDLSTIHPPANTYRVYVVPIDGNGNYDSFGGPLVTCDSAGCHNGTMPNTGYTVG